MSKDQTTNTDWTMTSSRGVTTASSWSESDVSWNGVLVVDKPAGPTSHDVVDRVRAASGLRRVGHTGTLDPFATGVLAVCVGRATRLARFISQGLKVYQARVKLGFATMTDDATGEPLGPIKRVDLKRDQVARVCESMIGEVLQVPPCYSAKRVAGRRAYENARMGRAISPKSVMVRIEEMSLEGIEGDSIDIRVTCSPGTYVRAIARDLGCHLGTGGHLTALRRLKSGEFTIDQAVPWGEIDDSAVRRVIPLSRLLRAWPCVVVGDEGLEALRHGRAINSLMALNGFPMAPAEIMRMVDISGRLVAIARPSGFGFQADGLSVSPVLRPVVVLLDHAC